MESLRSLTPLLSWLAGAGAGWLASWLFDRIREDLTLPEGVEAWLYTPRYARYASIALAVFISIAATAGIALIEGAPVLNAVDAALAGLIAAQIRHARLSLPGPVVEVNFTPDLDSDSWEDDDTP